MNRNDFFKHPVYSSVIAGIILAALGAFYLWIQSIVTKVSFESMWHQFLQTDVRLYKVLLVAFGIYVVTLLIVKSKKRRWRKELQKKASWIDEPNKIKYLWDVELERGKLYCENVRIYCMNHGIDMKFDGANCPATDCQNHKRFVDYEAAERMAESIFEHQLKELKAQ